MSKPVFHHLDLSPPSRFACIVAQHIGLDFTIRLMTFFCKIADLEFLICVAHFFRTVDLLKNEHHSPEYLAINPTKTVPALVDGDLNVFDSSAISIYLVEKYAKDDLLYPKDFKLRAKVNERLFYVSSYIFPRFYQILIPIYFRGETTIPQSKLDEMLNMRCYVESS